LTTLGVFRDDAYNAMAALPQNQYTTSAVATSQTLAAAVIAGAQEVYFNTTGPTGAVTYTTDTAANIIARLQNSVQVQLNALGQAGIGSVGTPFPGVPNLFNVSYYLDISNNGSAGSITLAAGTGVTITGTATILFATSRGFLVTVTGPATITIQNIGSGGV
jgi:hypothetical protein